MSDIRLVCYVYVCAPCVLYTNIYADSPFEEHAHAALTKPQAALAFALPLRKAIGNLAET